MDPRRLILASASPRRAQILTLAGYPFTVISSGIPEKTGQTAPDKMVEALSLQKASDVFSRMEEADKERIVVVGADTVVSLNGEVLGKPADEEEAHRMLRMLSGATHEVFTGVSVVTGEKNVTFHETTAVTFFPLTDADIDDYISTGEPFDKAGAYGIQGRFAVHVASIHGDFYNVMGLPVARLHHVLLEELSDKLCFV